MARSRTRCCGSTNAGTAYIPRIKYLGKLLSNLKISSLTSKSVRQANVELPPLPDLHSPPKRYDGEQRAYSSTRLLDLVRVVYGSDEAQFIIVLVICNEIAHSLWGTLPFHWLRKHFCTSFACSLFSMVLCFQCSKEPRLKGTSLSFSLQSHSSKMND